MPTNTVLSLLFTTINVNKLSSDVIYSFILKINEHPLLSFYRSQDNNLLITKPTGNNELSLMLYRPSALVEVSSKDFSLLAKKAAILAARFIEGTLNENQLASIIYLERNAAAGISQDKASHPDYQRNDGGTSAMLCYPAKTYYESHFYKQASRYGLSLCEEGLKGAGFDKHQLKLDHPFKAGSRAGKVMQETKSLRAEWDGAFRKETVQAVIIDSMQWFFIQDSPSITEKLLIENTL